MTMQFHNKFFDELKVVDLVRDRLKYLSSAFLVTGNKSMSTQLDGLAYELEQVTDELRREYSLDTSQRLRDSQKAVAKVFEALAS